MPRKIDEEKLFLEVVRALVSLGFTNATTKQIALNAGVNEVTIFRKYGNKNGLIEAAFEHILARSPLNDLIYTGDLEKDLLQIVRTYRNSSASYGEMLPAIISETPRNPELNNLLAC